MILIGDRHGKFRLHFGYDRIVGAFSSLGYTVCDQTVGNILRRHGLATAPKWSQTTTWKALIAAHMAVLVGIDFFTVEVLTWRGLVTYYVLFSFQLESHRVNLAGITRHPDAASMEQMARNAIDPESGYLRSQTSLAARPRYQVLCYLSIHPRIGRREVPHAARRAART